MKQYWKKFAGYMKQPATKDDIVLCFIVLLICTLGNPWLFKLLLS